MPNQRKYAPPKQYQNRPNVYMNEFNSVFCRRVGITEAEASYLTQNFVDTIKGFLDDGKSICFPRFGVFEVSETKPRMARNPRTGAKCFIPAGKKPEFRFCKDYRQSFMGKVESVADDAEPTEKTAE